MVDLVRKHDIQVFDHGIRFAADTGYTVAAYATPGEIRKLQQNGYAVVPHEDADEAGKLRQREVGRGNRYTQSTNTAASAPPPSPSRKREMRDGSQTASPIRGSSSICILMDSKSCTSGATTPTKATIRT